MTTTFAESTHEASALTHARVTRLRGDRPNPASEGVGDQQVPGLRRDRDAVGGEQRAAAAPASSIWVAYLLRESKG
jgi:hypothetical protein